MVLKNHSHLSNLRNYGLISNTLKIVILEDTTGFKALFMEFRFRTPAESVSYIMQTV